MSLDERAREAGFVFHHEVSNGGTFRTRYFMDTEGKLFIGCYDAHGAFYWLASEGKP